MYVCFKKNHYGSSALSYVTRVKGHIGYDYCTKCPVYGALVTLCNGFTKSAKSKRGPYLDLDVEPRDNDRLPTHMRIIKIKATPVNMM